MKRTDLEKNAALKLMGKLKSATPPARFAGASAVPDRREQRRLDQAAGLVSFPVKLRQPLIDALQARAEAEGLSVNEVLNSVLAEALEK